MDNLKHVIISRARFKDKNLRDKYYKITKEILIPAIKNQKEKNFIWMVRLFKEDINYTQDYFEIDFLPMIEQDYKDHMKENNYTIQTRHDIDDWMSPDYVNKIQEIYKNNINKYEKFLIHTQPIKFNYINKTKQIKSLYHDRRISMFLSLCQRNCTNTVYAVNHTKMWTIAPKVFTIPEGYVEWVNHKNNITYRRKIIK
ncbi:hypothetical protein K9L16_04260 [Candidatus Pacearchaeota archaeon]|nr:hypothetical protein [Candidatus Pacearchaeota archaeon]